MKNISYIKIRNHRINFEDDRSVLNSKSEFPERPETSIKIILNKLTLPRNLDLSKRYLR